MQVSSFRNDVLLVATCSEIRGYWACFVFFLLLKRLFKVWTLMNLSLAVSGGTGRIWGLGSEC